MTEDDKQLIKQVREKRRMEALANDTLTVEARFKKENDPRDIGAEVITDGELIYPSGAKRTTGSGSFYPAPSDPRRKLIEQQRYYRLRLERSELYKRRLEQASMGLIAPFQWTKEVEGFFGPAPQDDDEAKERFEAMILHCEIRLRSINESLAKLSP